MTGEEASEVDPAMELIKSKSVAVGSSVAVHKVAGISVGAIVGESVNGVGSAVGDFVTGEVGMAEGLAVVGM